MHLHTILTTVMAATEYEFVSLEMAGAKTLNFPKRKFFYMFQITWFTPKIVQKLFLVGELLRRYSQF